MCIFYTYICELLFMINTILYSFIQMIFLNVNGMYKDVVLVFSFFHFFFVPDIASNAIYWIVGNNSQSSFKDLVNRF